MYMQFNSGPGVSQSGFDRDDNYIIGMPWLLSYTKLNCFLVSICDKLLHNTVEGVSNSYNILLNARVSCLTT